MAAIASQITSLTIVFSTVYSDADQRKHQSTASLAFAGFSPGTGEFPTQMASNAENVSIWWRHHDRQFHDTNILAVAYLFTHSLQWRHMTNRRLNSTATLWIPDKLAWKLRLCNASPCKDRQLRLIYWKTANLKTCSNLMKVQFLVCNRTVTSNSGGNNTVSIKQACH